MDTNGNKVQTLRQQFENYEKAETIKYPSSILKKKTNKEDENNVGSRNGVYLSSSPSSTTPTPSILKRRPIVLDLHQCDNDEGLLLDEKENGVGDDLSLTSSSSSTCVNLVNGNSEDSKEIRQALTPTSSSSGSSTSGYGKVKRSNAFRANNNAGEKSKGVLERVKSLEISSGLESINGLSSGGGCEPQRTASLCLRPTQSSSQICDKKQMTPPKAVNVVTPYQVSDIYMRKNQEVEYAIPVTTPKNQELQSMYQPKFPSPPLAAHSTPSQEFGANCPGLNTGAFKDTNETFPPRPPEKPPRTFLYGRERLLMDQGNSIYNKTVNSPVNYPSVSSSPLTSSTMSYKQPQSVREATVRQTSIASSLLLKPKDLYSVPTNHTHHPPLVRSKTESQLVVKKTANKVMSPDYDYATKTSYYSSPPHAHQRMQFQPPQQYRSTTNLYNHSQYNFGLPPVNFHYYAGSSPQRPHDHRSNSLMYMRSEIDLEGQRRQLSVFNMSNNDNFTNRCPSDDIRLSDMRSKSEWSLHQASSPPIVHHPIPSNSQRKIVTNIKSSESNAASGTGHSSLESTSTTPSSTPQQQPHKKLGIQQSIQNLVNQLFSASSTMKDATSSTDSGIQLGSESLSSCDTPVGDSTTDTGDSECENEGDASNTVRQVVEQRKGYVRRVSSIRALELGASINKMIQTSKSLLTEPLFECLLIVGLNRDPYTGVYHAYIRDKFPPNAKLPSGVEQFCFPDSLEWPCHEGPLAQFYTLAITDQRGSRKFACCYRILPEGADICIPITYCVISSNRSIGFYKQVLQQITMRHGYNEYQKRFLMEELYRKQFPQTGGTITVTEAASDEMYNFYTGNLRGFSPTRGVSIKRRVDPRLDEEDLVTLLTTVDLPIVLKIFGSLLLERKVVLISRALSTLSLCVEALESMLFPFSWQHTYVPILPLHMTDVLDAPAPFLIGVLRSSRTPWDKTLDEGIVIDLDQNKIISCVGDENEILPKRINKKLREALQLATNLADQKDSTKNVLISECFIRVFVETMGHHSQHIVVQQDGKKIFERESFVKSSNSKPIQNFLEWFSETSMFHEFTQLRLKNISQHGLFEQRIIEQFEQSQTQHNTSLKFMTRNNRSFGSWLKDKSKVL